MTCKVQYPQCIQRTRNGAISRIFCKCCGYIIAEQRGRTFWRSRVYAEVKIRFADQSAHVTHLCKGCVPMVQRDKAALMDLYNADLDEMCIDDPRCEMFRPKEGPKIVAIDTRARGIR